MVFTARSTAHVNNLTWKRDRPGRITPHFWQVVVFTHRPEQLRLPRLLAVAEGAVVATLQGLDQAAVYRGGGVDPFVVGAGEGGGVVEPGPHYHSGRKGKDGWVGDVGDERFEAGPFIGCLAALAVEVPCCADYHVDGAGEGEEGEVEGAAGEGGLGCGAVQVGGGGGEGGGGFGLEDGEGEVG